MADPGPSRHPLELLIPPPVVLLLVGLGMWGLSATFPALQLPPAPALRSLLMAVLFVLGALTAGLGMLQFVRARTTVDPHHPEKASKLVTGGIYRLTRNPMYLGLCLFLTGWAVELGHGLAWLGLPAFALYITRFQIRPEERLLRERFGDAYREYAARVRRWV